MLSMLTRTLFASGYGGSIYSLSFDPTSSQATLSVISNVSAGSAPTWLTQHPTLPVLYTGDEFSSPNGVLSTFEIAENASSLSPIGQPGASKDGPVHMVVSPNGKELYSACYSAGALSTAKLLDNGTFDVEGKGQNFVYGGKGQNPKRQEAPHAHGVAIDPTGQFVWCTDLGTDQVHAYQISSDRIDYATSLSTTRGAGPRHLVFAPTASPERSLLYLVSELSNTVSIYEVISPPRAASPPPPHPPVIEDDKAIPPPPPENESSASTEEDVKPDNAPVPMSTVPAPPPIPKPTVNPIQLDVSILPPNANATSGDWTAAELELSRDRKWLYVSNRAPVEPTLPATDYLTVLELDDDGKIVEGATSWKELGGVGPRHFKLSGTREAARVKREDDDAGAEEGKSYMAVAFQRTNEVAIFAVEGKELSEVARVGGIEGATCVLWNQ